MDPRSVADLVRNEHPQIIAIVMSHLEPDQAAESLKPLPERTCVDVLAAHRHAGWHSAQRTGRTE